MRTLTQSNVIQLLNDYSQIKNNLQSIQKEMNHIVQAALIDGQITDISILSQVEECLKQAESILDDYTTGFVRFCRSIAKSQAADKPDETFLEKVRKTRSEAEEIRMDFTWMLNHLKRQILLHNMALGDFSAVQPQAPSDPQEPPITTETVEKTVSSLMTPQEAAGSAGTDKLPEVNLGGSEA